MNGERPVGTQRIHRGRLIDHLHLVVRDLAASRDFYTALLDVLDIPIGGSGDDFFWADELFVSSADSDAALGQLTGRHHLAFQAKDRAMVDAWHRAGLAAGGRDNGAPGERPYHPGYYAAFLLDPDGNNVEAVFHGEARQNVTAVEVEFDAPVVSG
jgi:catechol 2,3-dioxygenase-like lactoylglutathione lyase family enzyme